MNTVLIFSFSKFLAVIKAAKTLKRKMRGLWLGVALLFTFALPAFAVPAATAGLTNVSGDGGGVITTVNVTMPNSPIDAITFSFGLTAFSPSWLQEVQIRVLNASNQEVLGWFQPFPSLFAGSSTYNQTFPISLTVTSQGNWRIQIRDTYQDQSVNPDYRFTSGSVVFNTTPPADTEKPVIAPVANITTSTGAGASTANVSFATTVSDNVNAPSYFTPVYKIGTTTITSGHAFPVGTTTVTVTANADAAGNVPTPVTFTVTVNVPAYSVTKTLTSGADPVNGPGFLVWTVQVENTGLVALTSPTVTDVLSQNGATLANLSPMLDSGDDTNPGTLDPKETWVYTAQYNVTQADIDAGGDLSNTFTFAPENAVSQNGSDTVAINSNPKMNVVKTAALSNGDPIPAQGVSVGDKVKYTYTLTNDGNVTFSSMSLSDAHGGTGTLGAIGNCVILFDNGVPNDTVVNGAGDGLTKFGPADVVRCEALYTVVQSDIDTLQ